MRVSSGALLHASHLPLEAGHKQDKRKQDDPVGMVVECGEWPSFTYNALLHITYFLKPAKYI
ncbi:hypothetical protein E2C01_074545 [Portunus trituberculatus]|uniref:Uncharacterized protein n=1 Tax=Portunus trituberculatus TaxID=210409 RepID=A0A5B7IDF7_PORTR|nr:hypothetical protein [Portunus trituberculatus]